MTTNAEAAGEQAEQSETLDHLVRAGLVAYGVVHLLIAFLAVQLALGDRGEDASANGALHTLAQQPFGKVMVWAIALGMLLLVAWRLLEAGFGHRHCEGGDKVRKQVTSVVKAVLYGALAWTAIKVAVGSSSSGRGEETFSAQVMALPGGQWLVALVGLGIIAYGANLARRGWTEKFAEHLEAEGKLGTSGAAYLVLGKVGHIAKGVAFAVIGGLFAYAGFTHRPNKSGGLDEALQQVLEQPFGPVLLIAIGLGIGCYGLYSFARARHLDR